MEQLRLAYYEGMVRQEACVELAKAAIIQDSYDKKNYPRCLNDLTEDEIGEFFGEHVLDEYRYDLEEGIFDNQKKGHLVILREYKKAGETMSVKKIVLDARRPEYIKDNYLWGRKPGSPRSEWQNEMVCDLIAVKLLMPEDTLHHYIFKRVDIKQLSRIFQCEEVGVKARLIQYYYDNVVSIIEKYVGVDKEK